MLAATAIDDEVEAQVSLLPLRQSSSFHTFSTILNY